MENFSLNATSRSTIYVSWKAPTCPYGDIREYRVTYGTANGDPTTTPVLVKEDALQFYEIPDLVVFTDYTVSVRAVVTSLDDKQIQLRGSEVSGMIRTLSSRADRSPTPAPTSIPLPGATSSQLTFQIPNPQNIRTGRVM